MNKRLFTVATVAFLSLLALAGVALASYWLYSEVMTTNVSDYTLTIEQTINGLEVTISGQLLDPNTLPVNLADIVIYRCDSDGSVLETVATASTDLTGHYSHLWTASTEGTYYFKAGYFVT